MLLHVCALLFLVNSCLTVDLTYRIQEEKSPGTYIGDIAADTHLMDSVPLQDRRLIRFSLLEPDVADVPQLFRVSKKTGKLYTTQTLDAESLCAYNSECYRIIHLAVRRVNSFIRILKIRVIVMDINDHQPEFPNQNIDIQFSEGDWKGKKKLIPNALDKDISVPNSQITYQLQKDMNQPFTLSVSESVDETFDLRIALEERLDREVKDSYLIQVVATDGGSPPKQSVLDVRILVTDVNDNPPVFSKNVYNISVKNENYGVTPITILSASDLDAGKNRRITYHFSSKTSRTATNHFQLNKLTGEIFLQKTFASGQKLSHKLYVKATDGGSPPLSSVAIVLVNVISQQNNAPTIDVNFVSSSTENKATISEDIEVGSFMAYVKVTDHDAGNNGEVTCGLYHDKFQLEILGPKEYKVTVKSPVDREIEDQHDFTISCQDKGSPTQHTESKFSIEVIDVNDVRPQFLKETFKFWIYENQKSNFPVGYINASDPDQGPGGKLTFSLPTEKNQFLPFQITDSGLISTVISLDYEFHNIYKFPVFVEDNGIPSLNNTVRVVIQVKDKNDNPPYFIFPGINPFQMDVDYHPYHPNNITVLKASDSDSRENAFLKYNIVLGNDKQLFSINQYTGLLYFKHAITQQDAGSYILQITVRDSGIPVLSATTTLSLRLTVNNKTSEIFNTVHLKPDYQVHMYLLITVVLVAVTVSVPLTAAISICIIRCYNHRDAPLRENSSLSCKFVNEQENLVCRSQLAISWPDVPMALKTDLNVAWNSLPNRPKQTFHPADELANSPVLTTLGMKIHTAREVTYEVIFIYF